jgi:predicted O-methyltransferase YrrM
MINKIYFFILTVVRVTIYFFFGYKRYANILILILKFRPKSILEIGVYKGTRSLQMIQAALIFNNSINYYGFDLFNDFKADLLSKEFSKQPQNIQLIRKKLNKYKNVILYKGYTNKTLPIFLKKKKKIDFAFIDGGHSVKTIKNDWKYTSQLIHKKSIVIFDDFYVTNKINNFGCNKIIKNLDKKYKAFLLPFVDSINFNKKKVGVRMVLVKSK